MISFLLFEPLQPLYHLLQNIGDRIVPTHHVVTRRVAAAALAGLGLIALRKIILDFQMNLILTCSVRPHVSLIYEIGACGYHSQVVSNVTNVWGYGVYFHVTDDGLGGILIESIGVIIGLLSLLAALLLTACRAHTLLILAVGSGPSAHNFTDASVNAHFVFLVDGAIVLEVPWVHHVVGCAESPRHVVDVDVVNFLGRGAPGIAVFGRLLLPIFMESVWQGDIMGRQVLVVDFLGIGWNLLLI